MYFSKMILADIVEFGVLNGADRADLCRAIGITLSKETNLQEQVSYNTMVKALSITGQTINDDYLGLHLGEQVMLKGTEPIDNIMRNSPTIEEAFANAVNFSKLISDALTSTMVKTENYTRISFEVNPNWAVLQSYAVQQIIDMTLVCTLKSIYWLSGKKHSPVEVHLNYPTLKKKKEYYRVFDCTVKFKELVPCIIFHNPVLNQSVPSHNLGLLDFLKKVANEEIEKIQTEDPLIIQIKEMVLKNLPQKSTITHIAKELHLSSRTLQRMLYDLKTNFKQVEKDILLKLARKLILYEDRNMEEISYILGFSESSAFIRFFKKEMNVTPKKYKISNLDGNAS